MSVTIMIVEDHEQVRGALRDWLQLALGDCQIVEAATGEDAVDIAAKQQPALVLMDLDLPQMNGIEATQKIKSILPKTQVVVLTIYEDEIYRSDAFASGATAFVPKRKMQTELLPALTALLSSQLQFGSISNSRINSNNNGF